MEDFSICGKKIIDRFTNYMNTKGLNDNKVTLDLGLSVGTIGKSRKDGRDLSNRNIEKILNFYTDLDRIWLLTGEGEMLKKGGDVVSGNKVTATNGGVAVTGNAHHFTANAAPTGCASPELEERVRKNEEQIRTHGEKLKSQEERIKSLEERFNLSQALIDEKERLIQVLMEKGK